MSAAEPPLLRRSSYGLRTLDGCAGVASRARPESRAESRVASRARSSQLRGPPDLSYLRTANALAAAAPAAFGSGTPATAEAPLSGGGPARAVLAVLVRGESFREGAQKSRRVMADGGPQLEALRSVRTHVLGPAAAAGWDCALLADAWAPPVKHALLRSSLADLGAHAVRIPPLAHSQHESLASSLRWAAALLAAPPSAAPPNLSRFGGWRALLVLRADLQIKRPLPLPPPAVVARDAAVLLPFEDARLTPLRR